MIFHIIPEPEREVPVKDFIEEHKRLKRERNASQLPAQQTAATPAPAAAQQPSAQPSKPAAAPQHTAAPSSTSQRAFEPEQQAQQLSLIQLVEQLRSLGYDVQPLESLKGFADLLDAEEKRLMKEINERQERLKVVREARRLLRVLGV